MDSTPVRVDLQDVDEVDLKLLFIINMSSSLIKLFDFVRVSGDLPNSGRIFLIAFTYTYRILIVFVNVVGLNAKFKITIICKGTL